MSPLFGVVNQTIFQRYGLDVYLVVTGEAFLMWLESIIVFFFNIGVFLTKNVSYLYLKIYFPSKTKTILDLFLHVSYHVLVYCKKIFLDASLVLSHDTLRSTCKASSRRHSICCLLSTDHWLAHKRPFWPDVKEEQSQSAAWSHVINILWDLIENWKLKGEL